MAQGLLIHQVSPQYPLLARQSGIQGTVVLQAVIGKDGTVQNVHAISGPSMLTQAAVNAVKQWRYQPYYLNGEPVEADTQINVKFLAAISQLDESKWATITRRRPSPSVSFVIPIGVKRSGGIYGCMFGN